MTPTSSPAVRNYNKRGLKRSVLEVREFVQLELWTVAETSSRVGVKYNLSVDVVGKEIHLTPYFRHHFFSFSFSFSFKLGNKKMNWGLQLKQKDNKNEKRWNEKRLWLPLLLLLLFFLLQYSTTLPFEPSLWSSPHFLCLLHFADSVRQKHGLLGISPLWCHWCRYIF